MLNFIETNGHPIAAHEADEGVDWRVMLRGRTASREVRAVADRFDWRLYPIAREERDRWLAHVIDAIESAALPVAGPMRHEAWERGWAENAEHRNLIPRYFGKYPLVRWCDHLMRPHDLMFELHALATLQCWLADLFMRGVRHVYEFGAGTGHNLARLQPFLGTDTYLHALDWSQSGLDLISAWSTHSITTQAFDFFAPDPGVHLEAGSAVMTCAALEQTGDRFGPFIEFLLREKPAVVVHIEPLVELMELNSVLDYLCLRYAMKRGYLRGLVPAVQLLEREGRARIHALQRTHVGSLFLEGYSVLVWSPI